MKGVIIYNEGKEFAKKLNDEKKPFVIIEKDKEVLLKQLTRETVQLVTRE